MSWTLPEQRDAQRNITELIIAERDRQDAVWGHLSPQSDYELLAVLGEEFGEVSRELLPGGTPEGLAAALIQLAAVAVLWREAIELRELQAATQFIPCIRCSYPVIGRQLCHPCALRLANGGRRIWQLHSALHAHAGETQSRKPGQCQFNRAPRPCRRNLRPPPRT